MKFMLAAVSVAALVSGCAVNSTVPEGYAGPTARIADSENVSSDRKADFFFVAAIDGKKVANALDQTIRANQGRGLSMEVKGGERPVVVRETHFHIVGQTHYAAPVLALGGTSYYIEGDVTFTPVADQNYVVKGSLGPDYSAVWIETKESGRQVGNKLLIKGESGQGRAVTLLLGPGASGSKHPEEIPPPSP